MNALSAHHLTELLDELRPLLVGRVVRESAALPPRDVLLVCDPSDDERGVFRVRLSAAPDGPRVHVQHGRVWRHKGPVGPFFELLARELEGARVTALEQPRGDRLALVRFKTSEGERRCLVCELTGRHANLVWTDGAERVLAMLVEPPAKAGRTPRLVRGEPWVPPPGAPPPRDPDAPDLGRALADAGEPPENAAALSWRVEQVLGGAVSEQERARAAKHLRDRLERRRGKLAALEVGLAKRREAAAGAERVRQDGELLKAALGELRRGQESVELEDWFGEPGARRTIALEPKRTPHENVERYFSRYKKLLRSAEELERELALARERAEAVEALLAELDADGEPAELEQRAVEAGLLEPLGTKRGARVQRAEPRKPYKAFTGKGGGTILVGRSARDNDELSLKVARGNDLWLHTADAPGSHVVLRVERNAEPHPEDVLDAAHLAVWFSPLRGAHKAGVHQVRAKAVRKPKGAPPGLVQLAGGKRRVVRIEPERLERLLQAER